MNVLLTTHIHPSLVSRSPHRVTKAIHSTQFSSLFSNMGVLNIYNPTLHIEGSMTSFKKKVEEDAT